MRYWPPAMILILIVASISNLYLNQDVRPLEDRQKKSRQTIINNKPPVLNWFKYIDKPTKPEYNEGLTKSKQSRIADTARIYIGYEIVPLTRSVSIPEPGYSKVYGYVGTYVDGEFRPLPGIMVEAWDVDPDESYDFLASNTTDDEGFFEIEFSSTDGWAGMYGTQDVILKMYLDTEYCVIQRVGTTFFASTEEPHINVGDGEAVSIYLSDENQDGVYGTEEYYNVTVADGKVVRYILENSLVVRDIDTDANGDYYINNPDPAGAAMILWYINRATVFMMNKVGISPPKVCVELSNNYTNTYYDASAGKIYVSGDDQRRDWEDMSLVLKEYAKFLLKQYSYLPQSSGFYWDAHTDQETAWVEGFGAFFGSAVKQYAGLPYPYIYDDYPDTYDLEAQYDSDGSINDEDVCGAVAGILWDLLDSDSDDQNSDGKGDFYAIPFSYIWGVVDYDNPCTIVDFYNYLINRYPVDSDCVKEIYYEHGVDLYGNVILSISADPREGVVPLTVSFTATASGGAPPYYYTWYINDETLHGESVEYTFYTPGTHIVECYVEDSIGNSDHESITIEVYDTLSLEIDIEPEAGGAPLTVRCTAYGSGGKQPYTFEWDFGDGHHGSGSTVEHTYTEPGYYTITCTMTDARGDSISASYTVSVFVDLRINVTYFGRSYTLSIWVDKEKYENTVYSHQYTVNRILSNVPDLDRSVVEALVYLHMHLFNPDDFPVENFTVYDQYGDVIEDFDVRERLYQEILICSHVLWLYISQEVMDIYLSASYEYYSLYKQNEQTVYLSIAAALCSYILSILAPIYDSLKYTFGDRVQELVKKIVRLFTMLLFGRKYLESHIQELTGSGGGGAISDPHEATMTIIQILQAYGLISSDDYNPFELYNNMVTYPDMTVEAMKDICSQVLDLDITDAREVTKSFLEKLSTAYMEKITQEATFSFLLGVAMGALAYFYFDLPISVAAIYGALVSIEAFSVVAVPVALAAVASVIATQVLSMTTYEYLCWRDQYLLSQIYWGLYANGIELLYPDNQRLNLTASEMFLRLVAIQRVTLYHYYANLYFFESTKFFPDGKLLRWYSGNASQEYEAIGYWLNFFTSIRSRTWYKSRKMNPYTFPDFILGQENESVVNLYVEPINPFPYVPENPSGIIVNINNTDTATLRLGDTVFAVYNKTWYTNFSSAIYAEDPYRNIYIIIFNPPDGKYEIRTQKQADIKVVNFEVSGENISMETVITTSASELTFYVEGNRVKKTTSLPWTFIMCTTLVIIVIALLIVTYRYRRKRRGNVTQ